MENNILITEAKFSIGDRVKHSLLEYHGLILDVDAKFEHQEPLSEELKQGLPKQPQAWYQVLVHGTQHVTYVAEQNLRADASEEEFEHPITEMLFVRNASGHYQRILHLQ